MITDPGGPLVGMDLVEVERFRRVIERRPRIHTRLFTEREWEYCGRRSDPVPCLAVRFAAKEAVGKLLGTGVVSWREVEVEPGPPPLVSLSGRTALRANEEGLHRICVSLSHTKATAGAVVTAVRERGGDSVSHETRDIMTPEDMHERAPAFTSDQMRELDRAAIEDVGIPSLVLMERAALGVAHVVLKEHAGRHTLIVCGRGNNGGDGLAAARILHLAGQPVACIVSASGPSELSEDARVNFQAARGVGVNLRLGDAPEYLWEEAEVILDCLLGTGATGEIREPLAGWARRINRAGAAGSPVVAVDVPSGVDAGSGRIAFDTVAAERTITFHALKVGLVCPPGSEAAGGVSVWDIGIPRALEPSFQVRVAIDSEIVIPGRRVDDHKYRAGFVGVMAGSSAFPGAALLTSRAASRAGAGYVRLLAPRGAVDRIASRLDEITAEKVSPGDRLDSVGSLLETVGDRRLGSLVIGPGLGRAEETLEAVRELVTGEVRKRDGGFVPTVLDADAVLSFAGRGEELRATGGLVLTPHAGELAALLGESVGDVTVCHLEASRRAAELTGQVVLLKGSNTIVAKNAEEFTAVTQGPRQLATAGTGDVLSGCIGAFLARGLPVHEAAVAGAFVHAEAGRVGSLYRREGLIAEDLIELFPEVVSDYVQERRPGWRS